MSTRRMRLAAALFGMTAASAVGAQRAAQSPPNDALLRAMRDELTRSMQQLRLDTLPKPYFIAYRVTESRGEGASARLGSLLGENTGREVRFLQVDLRVGDYAFDNTNYVGAGFMPTAFVGLGALPVDDDYQEFRRQIWLATDRAYKQALEALSQKRAALETRSRSDSLPDFSREPVTNTVDDSAPSPANHEMMASLARDLSAVFRGDSEVYSSTAAVNLGWSRELYVNSEGTSYSRSRPRASVSVSASTQAVDGTALSMPYTASAPSLAELPSRDSLMKGVRDLQTRLRAQRHLPVADAYDGPVLFEDAAAAEIFNTMIGSKLVGRRAQISAPQLGAMVMQQGGGTSEWEDLIGATVLPRWISVTDDPSLSKMGTRSVESYKVDEEGVATHATTLVDHGVLKTFLTSRTPVQGVAHSTGNHFGNGARPVHMIVTADSTLSREELRRKLVALAAAQGRNYGVVITQISGGPGIAQAGRGAAVPIRATNAVKFYTDGHEEPMRAADMTGLSADAFKQIVAASQQTSVHSVAFAGGGNPFMGGLGTGPVFYQVPDLLFPNVSVRKPRANPPRLPFVEPPKP